MNTSSTTLSSSRVKITCIVDDSEKSKAREKALKKAQQYVDIPGFRVGHAPLAMVEQKVDERKLLEEIVHALLPEMMKEVQEKTQIKPIVKPSVSVDSDAPLTISIIIVGRPEVTLKKPESISVEKKDTTVEEGERKDVITKILKQDQSETEVERAAQKGDVVKIRLSALEQDGTPIDALTVGHYSVEIGAEEVLPELEEHVIGMKKNDEKIVEIEFKKDHDISAVQGKKVTVTLGVKSVMELKMPLLTAEYLKERLRVEKSVEEFEKDVQAMLESQKKDEEMKRREDELYEKVKNATTLDLAPELIDTEIQEMVQDLHERLAKQNMSMDQWLAQTKKDAKTVLEEMKDIAKSRLTLRFGMQEMTKEKKVVVAEEEMVKELDLMRKYAEKNGHSMSEEGYAKGGSVYEAIRIDLAVQSLIKTMIA